MRLYDSRSTPAAVAALAISARPLHNPQTCEHHKGILVSRVYEGQTGIFLMLSSDES